MTHKDLNPSILKVFICKPLNPNLRYTILRSTFASNTGEAMGGGESAND